MSKYIQKIYLEMFPMNELSKTVEEIENEIVTEIDEHFEYEKLKSFWRRP